MWFYYILIDFWFDYRSIYFLTKIAIFRNSHWILSRLLKKLFFFAVLRTPYFKKYYSSSMKMRYEGKLMKLYIGFSLKYFCFFKLKIYYLKIMILCFPWFFQNFLKIQTNHKIKIEFKKNFCFKKKLNVSEIREFWDSKKIKIFCFRSEKNFFQNFQKVSLWGITFKKFRNNFRLKNFY